jgi:peptidoglycan/LPS O-acetylase OafA/YrhL
VRQGLDQASLPSPSAAGRFQFADALRGVAAMWVVLFHMREGQHIDLLLGVLPELIETVLFTSGHLGVAIFFVLSGFVMRLNVGSQHFGPVQAVVFMARRLIRLAPPYYFAIAVTVALLFLKARLAHAAPPELSGLQWWSHLTFTTGILGQSFFNIVYWTLCVEIQFYLAFALMLWVADALGRFHSQPATGRTCVLAFVAGAAMLWPLGVVQTTWWTGGFVGFWFSFMAGVLVGHAGSGEQVPVRICLAYSLALLVWSLLKQDGFAFMTSATAMALWLAQEGRLPKVPGHGWRGWAYLGMVSYSLYLLHNPVTGVVFNVLRRTGFKGVGMDLLCGVLAVGACLIASTLAFRWVEQPAIRWSRQIRRG